MENGIIRRWWWLPVVVVLVGLLVLVAIFTHHITQVTHAHLFKPNLCITPGGKSC